MSSSSTGAACPLCGAPRATVPPLDFFDDRWLVRINGAEIHFSPHEYRILKKLAERFGRTVTRDQLLDAMYDLTDDPAFEKIVNVNVCRIRKMIRGTGLAIKTVYAAGYYLEWTDGD